MELKDRFGKALEHFHKTRKDFGDYAGFKHQYISGIITGRNSIGLKPLNKLLEFLPNLDANWLLKEEGDIEKSKSIVGESVPQYGQKDEDLRQAFEHFSDGHLFEKEKSHGQ